MVVGESFPEVSNLITMINILQTVPINLSINKTCKTYESTLKNINTSKLYLSSVLDVLGRLTSKSLKSSIHPLKHIINILLTFLGTF